MMVIEPKHSNKSKDLQIHSSKYKLWVIIGIIIALIIALILVKNFSKNKTNNTEVATLNSTNSSQNSATLGASINIKTFSDQQFRDLYKTFAFPNTKDIIAPPEITGNNFADARIRTIAESRGYILRSVVREPIPVIDNKQIQEKAVLPWNEMKKTAQKDGIKLVLLSGYRSPEEQNTLFSEELNRTGLSIYDIAYGKADSAINQLLNRYAPPGYSRHHTGYTIDISCPDQPGFIFARTSCFKWLSANNYNNAKRFGWIPSYPENTENQGPEPESWEYVWVGLDAVTQ